MPPTSRQFAQPAAVTSTALSVGLHARDDCEPDDVSEALPAAASHTRASRGRHCSARKRETTRGYLPPRCLSRPARNGFGDLLARQPPAGPATAQRPSPESAILLLNVSADAGGSQYGSDAASHAARSSGAIAMMARSWATCTGSHAMPASRQRRSNEVASTRSASVMPPTPGRLIKKAAPAR